MIYIMFVFMMISSLMVISSLNYTHAIFWLVLVFLLSASYFFSLKFYYIGFMLIIMYVGAMAILFMFVIMMLNFKNFTKSVEMSNFIPISVFTGMCFFFEMMSSRPQKMELSLNPSFYFLKKLNNMEALGWNLYYVFYRPFVVACFILLMAMVGAMLTQKIKLEVKKQNILNQSMSKMKEENSWIKNNVVVSLLPNMNSMLVLSYGIFINKISTYMKMNIMLKKINQFSQLNKLCMFSLYFIYILPYMGSIYLTHPIKSLEQLNYSANNEGNGLYHLGTQIHSYAVYYHMYTFFLLFLFLYYLFAPTTWCYYMRRMLIDNFLSSFIGIKNDFHPLLLMGGSNKNVLFIIVVIWTMKMSCSKSEKQMKLKTDALEFSLFLLAVALSYLFIYNMSGKFQYMHIEVIKILNLKEIVFTADGVSLLLLALTTLLIPICFLCSWKSMNHLAKEFVICLLLLELALILVFTVFDVLLFYIFFESTLMPMLLMMGVWGSSEEKVIASYYFFFYTLVGSLFMLLSLFKLYSCMGSTDYFLLENMKIPFKTQNYILWGFFFSFSMKVPKIPFHIWLPQAHVEAPVAGSVMLAGILLKLGGYGFLSFFWPLLPEATLFFAPIMMSLAILSTIYGGLTTCSQMDFKSLMAYSSVSHMGLVVLGLFTHTSEGLMASVFLMLTHGVVSGALFMGVTFLYERHHTRIIKYYRGIVVTMPMFASIFFILSLSNMAFPLSGSFISELFSLLSVYSYNFWMGVLAALSMLMSSTYTFYLYNSVFFGEFSNFLFYSSDLSSSEYYLIIPIMNLVWFMGILSPFLFDILNYSLLFMF